MRKNLWLSWMCLMVVCLGVVSCEEDKHICTLPVFSGFRISPSWNAGDSVTVVAVQQGQGDLLYRAEYRWSVHCERSISEGQKDTTFVRNYKVVYDVDKADPYIGFRLPKDFTGKKARITFSAQYNYSATAPTSVPNGSNNGQSGVYGRITVSPASQLYGTASGEYTYSWR